MIYSGIALAFLAVVSLIWLISAVVRKTNKKIPGLVFILSVIALIVVFVITGTTSDTANQNTVPSVNTADSSSTASSTETKAAENEQAKKNNEILKAQFDTYNDGNYIDATGAEVLTNDDGSIKYVQLNVNEDWTNLSEADQETYIDLLKAISEPFKDGDTFPYMQIQSNNVIVARSGAQDTSTVDIVK